ncbi:AAA family ATPase [Diaphorobacter sp. HDW4B]|uniref:replicative DNA helicase n=1 Tax=Diaphorobacter sp. HDW4B TaxID=2714925 RepID=UPI00140D9069|nr:DnaB-like helicase C-terminal domain-containing protein [Diaphorobacter sp. HDW4B]QIL69540.1 AAA family ATPase [Diaphorobacter sp. HDW4B]
MNLNDYPLGAYAPEASSLTAPACEAAVLSILIGFPDTLDRVGARLQADCFSVPENKLMFSTAVAQISSGRGCDAVSMMQALQGQVDPKYVHDVTTSHDHGVQGLPFFVDKLVDMSRSRSLFAASSKLAELAHGDGPVSDRIDQAQSVVQALEVQGGEDEWVDAYTAAIQHTELIEQRHEGAITGMSTGLNDFDEMLDGGLVRGNLVVIGARPAMGKTAFAMNIGLSMATHCSVGLLSMEMPHNDVRDRQAAILGRVSIGDIKRPGRGRGLDYSRVSDGVERSRSLRWFVSDRSGLNIQQVRSMARKLKRTKGLDVLIVDYIGLMEGLDRKQPRAYQIEEISRGLKGLAKELGIVVICLAQVNRGAAEKAMQPPGLHELRDSGAIEQDADVVAFIHRPIAANPSLSADWANYALMRIAKNRQGRIGDLHLFYGGETTTFEQWEGGPPTLAPIATPVRGRGML